jgi:hypothetical protein
MRKVTIGDGETTTPPTHSNTVTVLTDTTEKVSDVYHYVYT